MWIWKLIVGEKEIEETKNKYNFNGWKRSLPDRRDKWAFWSKYNKEITITEGCALDNERTSNDLRKFMPDVYDQGDLGSCTSNAICAAFEYDYNKSSAVMNTFSGSRLFHYYNERALEHTVNFDSGSSVRDGMKVLNSIGLCPEDDYPYNIRHFREKPSEKAFSDAFQHKGIVYMRVLPDILDFKKSIDMGYPVIMGFSVPYSFMHSNISVSGIMVMPEENERNIGGHCVLCCGYDDNMTENGQKGYMLCRNSWGEDWGGPFKGNFWMPYSFINETNVDDCWLLERVT